MPPRLEPFSTASFPACLARMPFGLRGTVSRKEGP
jgi:hypothetical protein